MTSPPQPADITALPRIPDPVPPTTHHPSLSSLTSAHTSALISIRQSLPKALRTPKIGIVCGSGLQGLAEVVKERVEVPYEGLEGFGESTVKGHQSALCFGWLGEGEGRTSVVCQLGRFHAYEGHPMESVIYPMRIMKLLGVEAVIITNAAGGLNADSGAKVGDVVVVQDHISLPSLTSMNPLIGPNRDTFGPRFPPMSDAYDFEMACSAFRAAGELGWKKGELREGVYAWVAGPTYETRAEQRFLKSLGADVVGMSTVPEVIAARHAGIRVLVLSLITNMVVSSAYRSADKFVENEKEFPVLNEVKDQAEAKKEIEEVASHQEVLDTSAKRAEDMRRLVERIVEMTTIASAGSGGGGKTA